MDFMRIGKARNLLMQSEKAKKALIDTLRKEEITGDMKNKLLKIEEIVSFCDRKEIDISLVNVVISSLLSYENPQTDDFIKVIEMLSECQRDLKNFVQENINPSIRNSKEFTEHYSAIAKYIKEKEENIKEKRKEQIQNQIVETPGLYIKVLTEVLNDKFGKEGFSYSTVLKYLNQLSIERKIITIGGPQGRVKYCFPHPSTIKDRSRYYNRIFGYQGIVEEKITDKFLQESVRKFRDIFLVNHVDQPILLLVDFGKLKNVEGNLIKSFGDLKPFEYLIEQEGFTAQDQVLSIDVLKASLVARMVDGEERHLWLDKKKADFFPIPH